MSAADPPARLSTGIVGLDFILGGGLPAGWIYLVEGAPGAGKTTLALQFLLEGVRRGESVLYFALSETKEELQAVAASHGWSLPPDSIHEISPSPADSDSDEPYTLFHPAEVELNETMKAMCREVDRLQPARIVVDSLAEMRLLAQESTAYRRQILSLKQFFARRRGTVLLLDALTSGAGDQDFRSLVHGVIALSQWTPLYGGKRRQLEIVKLRGLSYRDGKHDLLLGAGGITIFPRLYAEQSGVRLSAAQASSGIDELDALLGGGLHRGTSTLFVGPSGAGKSLLAWQYCLAAAKRGERSAVFCFDEEPDTIFARTAPLGMDLRGAAQSGLVAIQHVNRADLTPGDLAHRVRRAVENDQARLVVIDSLDGYIHAIPEDRALLSQLHELLSYLAGQGVVSLLILPQHGLFGPDSTCLLDVSYLADALVLMRYFETDGEVRKSISVLKKRTGGHELTIRELIVGPGGVRCGPPLSSFHGVLTGSPSERAELVQQTSKVGKEVPLPGGT